MTRKSFALAFTAATVSLCCCSSVFSQVKPMEREEVIQRSNLIFVGTVMSHQARWNEKKTLIVTDYEFEVEEVLYGEIAGKTIVLNFAGGQLGELTHGWSGVTKFFIGERVAVMALVTEPSVFCPTVGGEQGKYTAIPSQNGSTVRQGTGQPVLDDSGKPLMFDEFVQLLKSEIPTAKRKPLPSKEIKPESLPVVLKNLPEKAYQPINVDIQNPLIKLAQSRPLAQPELTKPFGPPDASSVKTVVDNSPNSWTHTQPQSNNGTSNFVTFGSWPSGMVVFEPWPDSFNESIRHYDQFQMSLWNRYSDVFRVTAPNGTWAYGNGVSEMAGFPSNATMMSQFGLVWNSSFLGYTGWVLSGQDLLEADICLNPNVNWTTDGATHANNADIHSLQYVLDHELGHGIGLDHDFGAFAVMNGGTLNIFEGSQGIFLDDTLGAKSLYPNATQTINDLGIYFRHFEDPVNLSDNFLEWEDSFNVSNILIQNLGETTLAPEIDWYLTTELYSFSEYAYIGRTNHSNLGKKSQALIGSALTIPSGVEPGLYFLAALIRNSEDEYGANDFGWLFYGSDTIISISKPTPPPNDDFMYADNTFLPEHGNSEQGINFAATLETGEPEFGLIEATVWWKLFAPGDGEIVFDTFNSNFDTMLDVHTGPDTGSLQDLVATLGANDDSDGTLQSQVTVPVKRFQDLFVRVGGYNGETGDIQLNMQFVPATVLGDVNLDGSVNLLDVDPFISVLGSGVFQAEADTNQDGQVNLLDVDPFIVLVGNGGG